MYPLNNILPETAFSSGISLNTGIYFKQTDAGINAVSPASSIPKAKGAMACSDAVAAKDIPVIKSTTMKKLKPEVNPFLLLIFPLLLAFLTGMNQWEDRSSPNVHPNKDVQKTEVRRETEKEKKAVQVSEVPDFLLY